MDIINGRVRMTNKEIVEMELISFVKRIRKEAEDGIDRHLCDHLLWIIEDYYKMVRIINPKRK